MEEKPLSLRIAMRFQKTLDDVVAFQFGQQTFLTLSNNNRQEVSMATMDCKSLKRRTIFVKCKTVGLADQMLCPEVNQRQDATIGYAKV
jgi:hypothetical protein